jgi:hypothetical protein
MEARCINCGGSHNAFSKDCGKKADKENINRLSPHFRPPEEDFTLLNRGGTLTLSTEIMQTPLKNLKVTLTTPNNDGSW